MMYGNWPGMGGGYGGGLGDRLLGGGGGGYGGGYGGGGFDPRAERANFLAGQAGRRPGGMGAVGPGRMPQTVGQPYGQPYAQPYGGGMGMAGPGIMRRLQQY